MGLRHLYLDGVHGSVTPSHVRTPPLLAVTRSPTPTSGTHRLVDTMRETKKMTRLNTSCKPKHVISEHERIQEERLNLSVV